MLLLVWGSSAIAVDWPQARGNSSFTGFVPVNSPETLGIDWSKTILGVGNSLAICKVL